MTTISAPAPGGLPGGAPDLFTPGLLQQLDRSGPRYTSYPTADRFGPGFGPADYRQALQARAAAPAGSRPPLSVYVHVPFCESVCYYCACNKVVTRHHERAAAYLDALEREMQLHLQVLGPGEAASQLHLGGGTPTFLSDAELQRLVSALRAAFNFVPGAEMSIEVDPRTATPARLAHLAGLGFNRLSFGVQDFDPAVQQAVHRVQPFEQVQELMASARALGFESVNVDLIYGLPRQTAESFRRTIAQVGALRPDRIALYAYAHLPDRFKPQRRIVQAELPDGAERVAMLGAGIAGFLDQGYDYIGMDHFALPQDPLAVARRQGRLHRNFQGYSTQPDCDLVALGVSAIGRVGPTYSQNARTLDEYYEALRQGRFPTVRGLALDPDDRLRRDAIMGLMCQGRLDFDALEHAHGIRVPQYFAAELRELQPLAELGLVSLQPRSVQLTPTGWYFVRAVAMVFDRHLRAGAAAGRFSRIV
jgi:oxygen-independent coproporphyrinogen-3 oxidase